MVFMPNPVASSGNPNLTDNKDADSAALNSQRVTVELANLDGSGYLRGRWATVVSETGDPAFETDCTYFYTRHDDRFEQVMAYYWVTQSQLYMRVAGLRRDRPFAGGQRRPAARPHQPVGPRQLVRHHPSAGRDALRQGRRR